MFPSRVHKQRDFSFSLFFSCVKTPVDSRLASSSKRRLINHKEKLQMKIKTKQDFEHELEAIDKALELWKSALRIDAHTYIKIFKARRKVILAKLENQNPEN